MSILDQLEARRAEVQHHREHFEQERVAYLKAHEQKLTDFARREGGYYYVLGELDRLIAQIAAEQKQATAAFTAFAEELIAADTAPESESA